MHVSPQIRVDDEVYEYLKHEAEPFVDTPNAVLRRLLGIDDRAQTSKVVTAGEGTPQDVYHLPILASLTKRGGSASVSEVLSDIEEQMGSQLDSADRGSLKSGDVRWRNRVQWARLDLVKRSLLESTTTRGIWTITQAGRDYLVANGAGS